jgi:uncharacterized membrane protein YhdT
MSKGVDMASDYLFGAVFIVITLLFTLLAIVIPDIMRGKAKGDRYFRDLFKICCLTLPVPLLLLGLHIVDQML